MSYYAKRFFGQNNIPLIGLKLWYDSFNTNSYNGVGNIWYDLSSNGNNGVISGFSFLNNIITINGTSGYINSGQNLNSPSDYTFSIWINTTSTNFFGIFGKFRLRGSCGRIGIFHSTTTQNKLKGIIDFGNYTIIISSISDINTGEWVMCSMSVDRKGLLKIYVNGIAENQIDISPYSSLNIDSTLDMDIGIYRTYAGIPANFMNGNINDALVYYRALQDSEILSIYNSQKQKYGL